LLAPPKYWLKCNKNGASGEFRGLSTCASVFRDFRGSFIGAFANNLGDNHFAELMVSILSIEIAHNNGWFNLWLECDSILVYQAFFNPKVVPWKLQTK